MTFSTLKSALETAGYTVYQDGAPAGARNYIVLAVYGQDELKGDDATQLRVPHCQLDAFSSNANANLEGGAFVSILDTLDATGCPYSVQDISYDPDAQALRMIVQLDIV